MLGYQDLVLLATLTKDLLLHWRTIFVRATAKQVKKQAKMWGQKVKLTDKGFRNCGKTRFFEKLCWRVSSFPMVTNPLKAFSVSAVVLMFLMPTCPSLSGLEILQLSAPCIGLQLAHQERIWNQQLAQVGGTTILPQKYWGCNLCLRKNNPLR